MYLLHLFCEPSTAVSTWMTLTVPVGYQENRKTIGRKRKILWSSDLVGDTFGEKN